MDPSVPAPWIVVPSAPVGAIARPRIDELLDDACREASVVSVVAGVGYGKTTALAAWTCRVEDERPVAWVDARMAAQAPGGLWRALTMACQRALDQHGLGGDVGADGEVAHPGPHQLLDLLTRSSSSIVVVIDDLHEVHDRAALESLDLLIAYLPTGTTLVVASRWHPPLRLANLRLNGSLTEVRTCDLAFTLEEAQVLLDAHALAVDTADARRLNDLAAGWPVALRLAGAALARGADVAATITELAGREGQLGRYLAAEVFDQLAPTSREVLTSVSLVERCHPDLAAALTEVEEAGSILERAAIETGLFHAVPGRPGWLEPHPLARTFLRGELEARRCGAVGDLHHRAAVWFAEHEEWGGWLDHALRDPDQACLEQVVTRVGLDPLLRSTPKGQQVASGIIRIAPWKWPVGRSLALAVCVLADVDAQTAFGISEALQHTSFEDPADERLRVVALARVWRNLGRLDLATAELRKASWTGASSDELLLLRTEQVFAGGDGANYETLRLQATDALARAEAGGADRLALRLRVALGALALIEGAPKVACDHADAAALLGTRFGQDLAIPLAEIRVLRAAAARELGERERLTWPALAPLSTATRLAPLHLRLVASGLDLWRRWEDGVDPRLVEHEMSALLSEVDLAAADSGFVLSILEMELRLAEAVQDLPRAEAAVRRLPVRYHELPDAALLRAQLARIRRAHVQARLELRPLVKGEVSPVWPSMLLRILALDGVLAGLQGAPDTASLERAVELGASSGRKRPFLDLGADALRVLIERRNALPADGGYVDELIAGLELLAPSALAEPLTQAEVRVLKRLASMATLQEIADGLHLSRNTVKTHSSSIYRKLAVGSRRAAVARGQELGLLRAPARVEA